VTVANAPWVRYVTIESDPDFILRFCTSRGVAFFETISQKIK